MMARTPPPIIAAAIGLMLSQSTGNPFFDGAASIVIGVILGFTAALLAYESKGLLIGEAADPARRGLEIGWGFRRESADDAGHGHEGMLSVSRPGRQWPEPAAAPGLRRSDGMTV